MIGRKLVLGAMALGLCLGATPSAVFAKKCPARCKEQITTCKTACNEAGLKGNDKRKCKTGCKKGIVAACKAAAKPDSCSPSAAFLD